MIEVNNSSVTVSQWSTGVMLKVDSAGLSDRFLVEYTHSGTSLDSDALTLQRLGKTYGDFAIVPVPNYLLTVSGTISVSYPGGYISVTVTAATKPSGYDFSSRSDNDVDRAAVDDVETRLSGLLNVIYPVGSIYMSVNSADPSTLFGGEWDQIEDTFLLACGLDHAAGSTGGSETATVSAHTHGISSVYDVRFHESAVLPGTYDIPITDTTNQNSDQTINIMPPYLAVYVWKRTA